MSDAERRQLVREIFLKTRGLEGEAQESEIIALCGGDDSLQTEVRTLIREEMEMTDIGAAPTVFGTTDDELGETEETSLIGKKIGQFNVKSVIAGGGMGTVYEAFQEYPRRVVALKVMKAGITSRVALRRFEYESQVLARLRHPNIAQVYEAGAHDDGNARVPFFAMEYVPGAKSIIDYAQSRNLSTRERLELFRQVCDAVGHGHQKGVIHRDLKPSNILVDSSGQPKIIDFGVARSTDSDLSVTTMQTDIGQLIGTVQYMSPEQCNADPHDLDTRSDVYALGVVLYELLTGDLPYDIRQCAIHEAVRVIQEDVPPRPSSVDKALRGDIETIVLTSIEKDRERRYQSAPDLASDIERYLSNQPIEATPPSTYYRFRKFIRRNRTVVAAATIVVLALAGGTIGTTTGMIRAVQERDRAELAAQIAQETNDFLNNDLLAQADPENRGRRVTVREVIDIASERISGRFVDQPLVEASIRQTLGKAYHGLGDVDLALPHLREAIRIRERELGPESREALEAHSEHAALLETTMKWADAEAELRAALALAKKSLGETDPLTLKLTRQLAASLGDQGQNERAAEILEQLIVLHHVDDDSPQEDQLARIETMLSLAETYRIMGEQARAEAIYHDVIDAYQIAYRVEHPRTLNAMNNLGLVLWEQDRLEEAEQMFRETLDGRIRALGEMHLTTARTFDNLGMILSEQGEFDEAERLQRRALSILEQILGPGSPDTIICENNLADTVVGLGRIAEAETIMADVVSRARIALPAGHWHLGVYLKSHAETLIPLERYDDALVSLNEAYEIQFAAFGADHKRTQDVIRVLVDCYSQWGKPDDAQNWHARLTP